MRMGMMLNEVGRAQEALPYLKKAYDLDPLTTIAGLLYTGTLFNTEHIEEANLVIEKGMYDGFELSCGRLTTLLLANDFQSAREMLTGFESNFLVGSGSLEKSIVSGNPNFTRMSLLLARLLTVAEQGDSAMDPTIDSDLVQAADEGLLLHYYAFQLLAAAGLNDAAFNLAKERISLDDIFFRSVLFKPAFGTARRDPRVMELFDATTQLDYWLQTGNWPDFCADPKLPYDCEEAARQFRENPPQ